MSLTKTEENLVIWGGAALLLLLITLVSFISYGIFLPKKRAKQLQKMENIISLRNHAKKVQVLETIKSNKLTGSVQISPELPGANA
jgi:hypothetical protein